MKLLLDAPGLFKLLNDTGMSYGYIGDLMDDVVQSGSTDYGRYHIEREPDNMWFNPMYLVTIV